jgi:hypothetical protein
VKPNDQGFDETPEKIMDTSNRVSGTGGLDISFGNLMTVSFSQVILHNRKNICFIIVIK